MYIYIYKYIHTYIYIYIHTYIYIYEANDGVFTPNAFQAWTNCAPDAYRAPSGAQKL